jgi:hypothetical protein
VAVDADGYVSVPTGPSVQPRSFLSALALEHRSPRRDRQHQLAGQH